MISQSQNTMGNNGNSGFGPSSKTIALELYTLGGVRLLQGGSELDVNLGPKHLALLIYVFHERRPLHPLEVVERLGRGQDDETEIQGLKQAIGWLNREIPFLNIRMTSETIEGVGGVWLDTRDVDAAIDACKPAPVKRLYVGEFLEGFESGVKAFDEWARKERGRLKRAWDHALSRAAHQAEETNDWKTAVEWWRILVSQAPMRSETVARLLEAYARTGRRDEAAKALADYRARLDRSGVSEVPGVLKQVIARFPLLYKVATAAHNTATHYRVAGAAPTLEVAEKQVSVRPQEAPAPKQHEPDWAVEPAPAPPGAFDLSFDLPEVKIPQTEGLARAEHTSATALGLEESPAEETRSYRYLDKPIQFGNALGPSPRLLAEANGHSELAVDTVASSFVKIAASSSGKETPEDRTNGNSEPGKPDAEPEMSSSESDEAATPGDPRGNGGQAHGRAELDQPKTDKSEDKNGESDSSPLVGGDEASISEEAVSSPFGPAATGNGDGDRDEVIDEDEDEDEDRGGGGERDLYKATAAILAAFVEDDGGNGEDGPAANVETAAAPRVILFDNESDSDPLTETPAFESADPWEDFADAPPDGPVDEEARERPAHAEPVFVSPDFDDAEVPDFDDEDFEGYGKHFTRVRHEVTSVRKPWLPFLQKALSDLAELLSGLVGRVRSRSRSRGVGAYDRHEVYSDELVYDAPKAPYDWMHQETVDDPETDEKPVPESATGRAPESQVKHVEEPVVEYPPLPPEEPEPVLDEQPVPQLFYEHEVEPHDAPASEPYAGSRETEDEYEQGLYEDYEQESYGQYVPDPGDWDLESTDAEPVAVLRRFWYAPLVALIAVAAFAFGPGLVDMFSGGPGESAGSSGPTSPETSLPKVTIKTPSFVEKSVAKISGLFSGSILDSPGEWLLVADVRTTSAAESGGAGEVQAAEPAENELSAAALTMALEADLMQARYYFVFPRGRAMVALDRQGADEARALSLDDALSLASVEGISAVVAGTLHRGATVDTLEIEVFGGTGASVYSASKEVSEETGTLGTLAQLVRDVRRRLGEPTDDIEASRSPQDFLSDKPEALNAYVQGIEHLRAGRFREAGLAAREATRHDSTFSVAHRLLAESFVRRGMRRRARGALEAAIETSDHATERERLRILGDWLAWTGRLSDAALTYDELFNRHRDDVGALRSQAVVQRMVGALGGGGGNLRVSYSIDRYDWPRLTSIARYLGYDGSLPDVDSLVASIHPSPALDSAQ
jgi:DNA-binding SARP family transcriptional activator/tetratricopeptide (TPR) repeat protein